MLPISPDDPSTVQLKKSPALWREDALAICAKHKVAVEAFHPYAAGTGLVAAVSSQAVIKLIQPAFKEEWSSEHWALPLLAMVQRELPIAIPDLIASGELEGGWTYLILSRLAGQTMDKVWPNLPFENRLLLLAEIGAVMAIVHKIRILQPEPLRARWQRFLALQRAGCRARHERLNMPAWFVGEVESYVDRALRALPAIFEPTLLTGEYTPFNLHVEEREGSWHLSGMLDYGDAMAGFCEYDLIGPGVFLAQGDSRLVRSLLNGYGLTDSAMDDGLRVRLMGLHLLHRFSNFDSQVALQGWRERAKSLEDLAGLLWPA